MKNIFIGTIFLFAILSNCAAQLTKVNESCKQMPCESGLYCLALKNGDQKCATCDQSALNGYTRDVDEYCKGFEVGWTPGASPEFQDVLAKDGRVWVDVFDIMLEKAKKCKQAREYREKQCWKDGDDEHKKAISEVTESISRMSDHKRRQIDDRRVYYCSESTYESRLSTYTSKCDINFPDINQKLDILSNSIKDGKKVDCDDIEDYGEKCEYCLQAAKDLLYDGFRNNSSYIPNEYGDVMTKAQEAVKKAKDMYADAKNKSLCE